jgi:N-acyl-phosphatidylethanolamine-hydrolysing phospholipase D
MKSFPTWSTRSGASSTPRPSHWANSSGTAFKNPWPSAEPPTWTELFQTKFPLGWYDSYEKKHPETHDVKVVKPDWGESNLKSRGLAKDKCIVGTSLGHAGVISELPLEGTEQGGLEQGEKQSLWVVYDPIFSDRAGPTQYTGPQRLRPPPCQVTDLPGT